MGDMRRKFKILLVEDGVEAVELFKICLSSAWNFQIETCEEIHEAETRLQKGQFDLCLIDLQLKGRRRIGLRLLAPCLEAQTIPVVVTGIPDKKIEIFALAQGALDYVKKSDPKVVEHLIEASFTGLARKYADQFCEKVLVTADRENIDCLRLLFKSYLKCQNDLYVIAGNDAQNVASKMGPFFTQSELISLESLSSESYAPIVSHEVLDLEKSFALIDDKLAHLSSPLVLICPDRLHLEKISARYPQVKTFTIRNDDERQDDFALLLKRELAKSKIAIDGWAYDLLRNYEWPEGEKSVTQLFKKLKKLGKSNITHTDLPRYVRTEIGERSHYDLNDFPQNIIDLVDEKGLVVGMIELRKKIVWYYYNRFAKNYSLTAKKLGVSVSVVWEAINE